jgi:ribosome-associated translation inhibitor RaiA
MAPSPSVEKEIEHQISLLDRFYSRISNCHVSVEAPHRHHHQGWKFQIILKISVPGDCIVVSHDHDPSAAHEDCHLAVRDAFRIARRQIQDYARIRRHQVKSHHESSKRERLNKLEEFGID